jgi:hypothetical protein
MGDGRKLFLCGGSPFDQTQNSTLEAMRASRHSCLLYLVSHASRSFQGSRLLDHMLCVSTYMYQLFLRLHVRLTLKGCDKHLTFHCMQDRGIGEKMIVSCKY